MINLGKYCDNEACTCLPLSSLSWKNTQYTLNPMARPEVLLISTRSVNTCVLVFWLQGYFINVRPGVRLIIHDIAESSPLRFLHAGRETLPSTRRNVTTHGMSDSIPLTRPVCNTNIRIIDLCGRPLNGWPAYSVAKVQWCLTLLREPISRPGNGAMSKPSGYERV